MNHRTGWKACKACGQAKPPTQFYAKPNRADGRDSTCSKCRKAAVLARAYSYRYAYGMWPGRPGAHERPRALELLGMLSLGE